MSQKVAAYTHTYPSTYYGKWVSRTGIMTGVCLTVISVVALFSFCPYSPLALTQIFAPLTFKGSLIIGGSGIALTLFSSLALLKIKKSEENNIKKAKNLEVKREIPQWKCDFDLIIPSNGKISLDPKCYEIPSNAFQHIVLLEMPEIPALFTANQGTSDSFGCNPLTVRLNSEQIERLPINYKEVFENRAPTDAYLMVFTQNPYFDNSSYKDILLHSMALPEYNLNRGAKAFPEDPTGVTVNLFEDRVEAKASIGLWQQRGLKPCNGSNALKFDAIQEYQIGFRGCNLYEDNPFIELDLSQRASSFILTASFRKKDVIMAAIYIDDLPQEAFIGKTVIGCYHYLKDHEGSQNYPWLTPLFE